MVYVDVEYCGVCNFKAQCQMLREFLLENAPEVDVVCHQGRRGSFEVKIDEQLVHSKLKSLAFPQHASVLEQVQRAQRGEPIQQVQEAAIKDCCVM
ncbi:migration and invasion enhancer 1 [Scaptodrosophila lebanonensis]|uniref:Migration and invasion enhancer 1 n=1 Tax=Drosophila lebanonensis TaxID=7225 RepID=A0A6J2TYC5_DROLE|nr:migration and invasion enhancer 1 [Scaptodrosophila lebanonensis]